MGGVKTALQGIAGAGVGDGAFFMSLEPYIDAMEKNLGYTPFKGTFNLKVNEQQAKRFIDLLEPIKIDGFKRGIKQFGGIKCYPCRIKRIKCAIIIPEFTRYDLGTVEVISKEELRKTLNVKDGDKVIINITGQK